MKYVAIDTESTGLSAGEDRLVALACVSIIDDAIQADSYFHTYINPEQKIRPEIAPFVSVTDNELENAPTFSSVANEFLHMINGSTLVIHNAPFDSRFLVSELERIGGRNILDMPVIDILTIARNTFPGERNNIDALSRRLGIDKQDEAPDAISGAITVAKIWINLRRITKVDVNPTFVKSLLSETSA